MILHRQSLLNLLLLLCTFILTFTCITTDVSAESHSVHSPDGKIQLSFYIEEGRPSYSVSYEGNLLIAKSSLGFLLHDTTNMDGNFSCRSIVFDSHQETWIQPWGEKKEIDCVFEEMKISLHQQDQKARELTIVFRVFDDGVGFRYEWPEQKNLGKLLISDEVTEFNLTEDSTTWWLPAYQDNRYEYLYQKGKLSQSPTVHTPVTIQRSDGICLSIHEAALTDFASMALARKGLCLKADLVPWSDGLKVRAEVPHHSPWRTIQIANSPAGLIASYLILNLNEPSKVSDTSWIKPGKYVGVWWEMHLAKSTWGSGEKHGANTENVMHYIDFASENCFDGVLAEGWNHGWDADWTAHGDQFDFTTPCDDFDIQKLSEYANSKNVYLIGHHETGGAVLNYESQLNQALSFYERHGVPAIKTGYVNHGQNIKRIDGDGKTHLEWHHGQYMVRHYRKVIKQAAAHRIMLDVHEPIKDTGIRRTWPNMMTREGARGQEFNAWSNDGGNPPCHESTLAFTRMLAGPMDFTPGIFELLFDEYRPENRVNTTLIKQLALYVVLYSPFQMVPDLPVHYKKYPQVFSFIRDVPTDWHDTVVLHAEIGDFVTIARKERDGDQWYIGSITDEEGRSLEAPLDFLDANRKYIAEIYRDGSKADWQSNPYAYEIEEVEVDSDTNLKMYLAPGGGQAIRIRPKAN